ncbi:hypothetical protein FACS1894191_7170 [Clostridia bacterium]|nr:hypothetical protein FACS1894191_7170 [Clostridia bacterium]
MLTLILLLAIPAVTAAIVFFTKTYQIQAVVTRFGSGIVIALSILFCVQNYNNILTVDLSHMLWLDCAVIILDLLIGGYVVYVGVKNKSLLLSVMAGIQGLVMLVFDIQHIGKLSRDTIYILH